MTKTLLFCTFLEALPTNNIMIKINRELKKKCYKFLDKTMYYLTVQHNIHIFLTHIRFGECK